MCGRYALALPASRVRRQLQDANMPSQDAPDDDELRQTHNFAPGYYGLVYRADAPDRGAGGGSSQRSQTGDAAALPAEEDVLAEIEGSNGTGKAEGGEELEEATELPTNEEVEAQLGSQISKEPTYKLQKMKWGLVPFWTKRNPDYGSMMKTINCRDDSLATPGGMWNTMKQKKRCIVLAQGFYEWLKKDGGKVKVPHFVKRKDGQLMCFAGLWDCVRYEDGTEPLYTYTIITTDSNKQLTFLHDRMPVIFDNGSDDVFTWLDSDRNEWSRELQSLLIPYKGELECYPVTSEVGKVGNDSPTFIVPIDSKENKQNIANFFGGGGGQKQRKATPEKPKAVEAQAKTGEEQARRDAEGEAAGTPLKQQSNEPRTTINADTNTETNAPKPVEFTPASALVPAPAVESAIEQQQHGTKRPASPTKSSEHSESQTRAAKAAKPITPSKMNPISSKKTKNAMSNEAVAKTLSPSRGDGSKKITSFFGK